MNARDVLQKSLESQSWWSDRACTIRVANGVVHYRYLKHKTESAHAARRRR